MLLQIYLWFMVAYVAVSAVLVVAKPKKLAAVGFTAAAWVEQVAGFALLAIGLVGVYGYVYAVPVIGAKFWQAFVVVLALFAAAQHFMPKTQLLKKRHGVKAVVVATVVGVLLLVPMFVALGNYGFKSPEVWARV